jgi:hypothetical protein
MKSHLFAGRFALPAVVGALLMAPALFAQSTNLINDGTTVADLAALANQFGTGGATLSLTPDPDGLRAEQSEAYADFPVNGVWYADAVRPLSNAYMVLADVRPADAFPEKVVGVMGWLDPASRKGIVFRIQPGAFGAAQVAVVDFTSASAEASDSTAGLHQLDGAEAQPLYGSAWGQLGEYDPAVFATVSLAFLPATAADLVVVSNATYRVVARIFQGGDTPVGDTIELLTTAPVPAQQRFGYAARLDTLLLPGGVIGHVKNLRVTGDIEVVNRPPTVALTSPTNNAQFFAPATVTLTAEAADRDGTVTRVDFRQGATLLGSVPGPSASLAVSNLAVGSHTFTAVAVDNQGASTESAPVTIQVVASPEMRLENPRIDISLDGMPLMTFTVVGTAGLAYEAQVTFDLKTWLTVGTGTLAQNRVALTFPAYSDMGLAYYRMRTAPPPGQGNQSPAVNISSPTSGASFAAPASFNVAATAQDSDGQIARIEVYVGRQIAGTATASLANIAVSGLAQGMYQLTARAYDNAGAGSISPPVLVNVTGGQITPSLLSAPRLLPSPTQFAQFEFTASALSGGSFRVESSTNLVNWVTVETGVITGATRTFTYPRTTGGNLIFYRLVNLP